MIVEASSLNNVPEEDSKSGRSGANKTASNIEMPSMLNQVGDTMSQTSEYNSKTRLEDVSNEIFFLERETADLNRQYKELLAKSRESNSAAVLSSLRTDLNNIARVLEEKSEKLFELKKQQQLALKSY